MAFYRNFLKLREVLEESFGKRYFAQHYKKILFKERNESDADFLIKCMFAKILYEHGAGFVSEFDITKPVPKIINLENMTAFYSVKAKHNKLASICIKPNEEIEKLAKQLREFVEEEILKWNYSIKKD